MGIWLQQESRRRDVSPVRIDETRGNCCCFGSRVDHRKAGIDFRFGRAAGLLFSNSRNDETRHGGRAGSDPNAGQQTSIGPAAQLKETGHADRAARADQSPGDGSRLWKRRSRGRSRSDTHNQNRTGC